MSILNATNPRAYLFDLDGTLVDTAPDIHGALNAALRFGGYQTVSEDLTRHRVGFGSLVLIVQALKHQGAGEHCDDASHLESLREVFIGHYLAHIADHSKAYPEVTDTLALLRKRGCKLAVVTNKTEALTHPLLDALDLAQYFTCVVGGDTCSNNKPAAEPALFACAELAVPVQQSLFVGDSETDVLCARAADCAVVCMRDGYNHGTPAEELGADHVISRFGELLDYTLPAIRPTTRTAT